MHLLIADEYPASPGAMDALAQEVGCRSAVPVQAAATLPPSARSYRSSCSPTRGGKTRPKKKNRFNQKNADTKTGKKRGERDVLLLEKKKKGTVCAYLERVAGVLFSKLSVVGRAASLCWR